MRIPRIHHPGDLAPDLTLELHDAASAHLLRVLRLRPGAAVVVFNGDGGEYDCVLEGADEGRARLRVGVRREPAVESPLAITLAQGISRGERMDYTLQKSVELGVRRIVPLTSEFCQVRLDGARMEKRLRHWQGVINGACEQSGRTRLPELGTVHSLPEWLAAEDHPALRLVLDPRADHGLAALAAPDPGLAEREVILLIGPEGGLSEREIAMARAAGYTGLRLGPRVLRTETAGVAALAALQTLWGDFAR